MSFQNFVFHNPKIQNILLSNRKWQFLLKAPNTKVVHVVFKGKHLMDLGMILVFNGIFQSLIRLKFHFLMSYL